MNPAEYEELKASRQRNILAKTGHTKRGKKQLLKLQNGQCALCKETIPATSQICYDKKTSTIICRSCMMLLSSWRYAQTRGVTNEMVAEHELQAQDTPEPTPEPEPKPVRPTSTK